MTLFSEGKVEERENFRIKCFSCSANDLNQIWVLKKLWKEKFTRLLIVLWTGKSNSCQL